MPSAAAPATIPWSGNIAYACSTSSVTSIVSLQVKGWRDVSSTAVVLSKSLRPGWGAERTKLSRSSPVAVPID